MIDKIALVFFDWKKEEEEEEEEQKGVPFVPLLSARIMQDISFS